MVVQMLRTAGQSRSRPRTCTCPSEDEPTRALKQRSSAAFSSLVDVAERGSAKVVCAILQYLSNPDRVGAVQPRSITE